MRTVDDVLRVAKSAGVNVLVEGYDLVLEHEADPPPNLVAMLRHYKPELVSALRMRQAAQSSLITQWVNDHFVSSPSGVCAHCGEGPRSEDPFVCCSSETIEARCTPHVMRRGKRSGKERL